MQSLPMPNTSNGIKISTFLENSRDDVILKVMLQMKGYWYMFGINGKKGPYLSISTKIVRIKGFITKLSGRVITIPIQQISYRKYLQ